MTGPAGRRFLLPEDAHQHQYVFVATGTGIAPFRGMIADLLSGDITSTSNQIHLVMGVPYTSDLLYDDEMRQRAETHPNFFYHRVISRELDNHGHAQGYVHDYLARTPMFQTDLLSQPNTLLYLCGLAGMQSGVYQYLGVSGLAESYLKLSAKVSAVDPQDWGPTELRRIRPTARCLVEVY